MSLTFKLELFYFDNESQNKVPIIKLTPIVRIETCQLRVQGDSKLILKQVNEEFTLKDTILVPYPTARVRAHPASA